MIYRVTTHNACFGIISIAGIIVDSAPIAKKVVGMSDEEMIKYFKTRWKAKIERIKNE